MTDYIGFPGNAAPQSGCTKAIDGDSAEDLNEGKRYMGSESLCEDSRSGERRSQGGEDSRSGERRSQGGEDSRSGERRSPGNLGWYSRGYLPHCDTPGLIQHITYHLADSLPYTVLERLRNDIELLPVEEEKKKVELRRKIETYLDAGHGSCILREPEVAACVLDTWFRFDGERYRLLEWVVMPNHCHVLIEVLQTVPLGRIIASWKNYTARFINRYTDSRERRSPERLRQSKRPGVWHRDYWDRYIRDDAHYAQVKAYIALNPVKAGLAQRPEDWLWSSAAMRRS